MKTANNKREFVNKLTIKLTEFEKERKKGILRLIGFQILSILIAYLFFKGTVILIDTHSYIAVFCSIISLCGVIYFFYNFSDENKKFKKFLKEKCKYVIQKTFNLTTMKGAGFSDDLLKKSNLFCIYTYQETDDVILGSYNDVEYKIAETKLVAKGRKNEIEVFRGVIISFESNKNIVSETLVTSKKDKNIRNYPPNYNMIIIYLLIVCVLIPMIGIMFYIFYVAAGLIASGVSIRHMISVNSSLDNIFINLIMPLLISAFIIIPFYMQKKKMKDVKLEDVSFDKKFNVYTKDQVEARYLLTPAFMSRLKSLETAFGTKGIKCSFFDGQIMFAIPTRKDLFELGSLYRSLNTNKSIEDFYNELNSIQQMIDHFKLDEKTGL